MTRCCDRINQFDDLPESLRRLAGLNAAVLRSDVDFRVHADRLVADIERIAAPVYRPRPRWLSPLPGAAIATVAALLIAGSVAMAVLARGQGGASLSPTVQWQSLLSD